MEKSEILEMVVRALSSQVRLDIPMSSMSLDVQILEEADLMISDNIFVTAIVGNLTLAAFAKKKCQHFSLLIAFRK